MATTTVTEEATVPENPSIEEDFGFHLSEQERINVLPSDPFQSHGQSSQRQETGLHIHRGRSPVTPTPSAGHLRRQT
jgi:hypothetical protein